MTTIEVDTYIGGILQRRLNHRLSQEDVTPAGAPQHPLEGRQSLPQDDASHEARGDYEAAISERSPLRAIQQCHSGYLRQTRKTKLSSTSYQWTREALRERGSG